MIGSLPEICPDRCEPGNKFDIVKELLVGHVWTVCWPLFPFLSRLSNIVPQFLLEKKLNGEFKRCASFVTRASKQANKCLLARRANTFAVNFCY